MRLIITLFLVALSPSAASAQYLGILGAKGPIDIYVEKPHPENVPWDRVLANNPNFTCPTHVACIDQGSANEAGASMIIEMDVEPPSGSSQPSIEAE